LPRQGSRRHEFDPIEWITDILYGDAIMGVTTTIDELSVLEILSETKFKAIKELIKKASSILKLKDLKSLEDIVIKREKLQSTACGHNVAFAHGKTHQVSDIVIVLGVSRKGIPFGAPDGRPVNMLFLIVSNPDKQLEYLMVLSSLAKIFHDQRCKSDLFSDMSAPVVQHKLKNMLIRWHDQHIPSGA
jgi:PTS system nitrogen regulatory IIA component